MSKKFNLGNKMGMMNNIAEKVNNIETKNAFNIRNINIELLVPSDKNFYAVEDIEKLAEDIKENSLLHNLVVRPLNDGRYEIISGERRYRACKKLGWEKVPCQVRDTNDIDSEILLIQANAKARVLTDLEKARQVKRLEELYNQKKANGEKIEGKIRDKIGQDLGISGVQVQRYKRLNNLIPELQQLLDDGKIGASTVVQFASMDKEAQKNIYNTLIDLGKNVTREEAKKIKEEYEQKINKLEQDYKELQDDFTDISQSANQILEEQAKKEKEYQNKIKSLQDLIDKLKQKQNESDNSNEIEQLKKQIKELEKSKEELQDEASKMIDEYINKSKEDDKSKEMNLEIKLLIKDCHTNFRRLIMSLGEIKSKEDFDLAADNKKALDELKEMIEQHLINDII